MNKFKKKERERVNSAIRLINIFKLNISFVKIINNGISFVSLRRNNKKKINNTMLSLCFEEPLSYNTFQN